MAEETSSLRQAIDKIMGWPAGGDSGGGRPLLTPPATDINVSNVIPDVVNTSPVTAAPAPAAPAATTPAAAAAVEKPGYHGVYSSGAYNQGYAVGSQADPNQLIGVTMENYNDPWIQESIAGLTTQSGSAAGRAGWSSLQANPEGILTSSRYDPNIAINSAGSASPSSASKAVTKAPRNPGPKAPWQESQQYWKDLAAYTGK